MSQSWRRLWVAGGLFVLIAVMMAAVAGCSLGGSAATTSPPTTSKKATSTTAAPTSTTATTETETTEAVPEGPYSDGTYYVGQDMLAGVYKGHVNGKTGHWKISRDMNGDTVVASGDPRGQFYLQVMPGQFLFLVGATITKADTTAAHGELLTKNISDGTYLVGRDIAAGHYKGTARSNGHWSLSTDANGKRIIAGTDAATGQFYLDIKAGNYLTLSNVTLSLSED
jgi:hypothetical protein